MTLKAKKISLGALAAVSIVATPAIAVVSCGSTKKETPSGEKIDWIQQTLRTESTKEMALSNIDVKDKTIDFITEAIILLTIGGDSNKLDPLKSKMDDASNANFPRFAKEPPGPNPAISEFLNASDADLKKMFNEQKEFGTKNVVEKLTLKTITLNFSDKTAFTLTFTKEEEGKIRAIYTKEMEVIKDALNLDDYKNVRSMEKAKAAKDVKKVDEFKKIAKNIDRKSRKISSESRKIQDELKIIFKKHVTNIFNKK